MGIPTAGKKIDSTCDLCKKEKGTLAHILSYCSVALGNGKDGFNRIKWRHDNILRAFVDMIKEPATKLGYSIQVDLSDHEFSGHSFPAEFANTALRPDLILVNEKDKKMIIAELTSPMEANMTRQHMYKATKYAPLKKKIEKSHKFTVDIMPFEVSARGAIAQSVYALLARLKVKKADRTKYARRLSNISITSSETIFYRRKTENWAAYQC